MRYIHVHVHVHVDHSPFSLKISNQVGIVVYVQCI